MRSQRVQVLGLTRWSYPFGSKGFRRKGRSHQDQCARLYAPQRLDHRLFLLEHVLIPGLRAQKDKDFTHIFLLGEKLPEPWRSSVLALLATVPQATAVFRPEGGNHRDVCREVMLQHVDLTSDVTAQYRLDDDDGVAVDFVGKTREMFQELSPFFEQCGRLALDYSRGFILRSTKDNISMQPVSMRLWAPGMAIYQRAESLKSALDFHHLKVWHDMPTLTWQEQPMFIRGAHHDNDSDLASFGRRTRGFEFNHRNPKRYFQKRFGLHLDAIEQTWNQRKAHFLALEGDATSAKRVLRAA
ncbi:MAG: glycosyltransferase [Sulfitobacter sp.]